MNQTQWIPKTIHYFWFGKKPKSELIHTCIRSWEKYAPDYQIIEWNEDNFDVYSCKYSAEAYANQKYAFVSDYARFKVLFEQGGFYLDTDVELLKPLYGLRKHKVFMGFESDALVTPGLMLGAQRQDGFIGEMVHKYSELRFMYQGHMNLTTIGEYTTALLLRKGLKLNGKYQELGGITIYPQETFCPYDYHTGALHITDNTYSIHHYDASWMKEGRPGDTESTVRHFKLITKLRVLSAIGEPNFFRIRYLLR